ncbi:MAG: helix-turn-helix domain-containing protein [Chloroflexota bacterium]|nr:helix-turn-helix domain-containing protein [Chloroflexota bacterium]
MADTVFNVMSSIPNATPIYVVTRDQQVFFPSSDAARYIATLGMPDDAVPFGFRYEGARLFAGGYELDGTPVHGENWQGYELTMIGTFAATPPANGPVVRVHLDNLASDERVYLKVWLAIVTSDQTRARLDCRWHPEGGKEISLRGLEHATLKGGRLSIRSMTNEAAKITRGIALINKVLVTGKAEGDTYLDDNDPDCIRRAYVALYEQGGDWQLRRAVSRPSQEDVAAWFDVSKPTLQRYLNRHELDWHKIRRVILPQ